MINDTKLGNRSVFIPRGRDPVEDLNILSDTIAASAANIFNYDQDECLILIAAGKRLPVTTDVLNELCKLYICTKHPRETADGWEVEYRPYEPDEKTLRALLMPGEGSLAARLPKIPRPPRQLPEHLHQAAVSRLKSGEPATRIADSYGCDVDAVKRLAR